MHIRFDLWDHLSRISDKDEASLQDPHNRQRTIFVILGDCGSHFGDAELDVGFGDERRTGSGLHGGISVPKLPAARVTTCVAEQIRYKSGLCALLQSLFLRQTHGRHSQPASTERLAGIGAKGDRIGYENC